MTNATATAIATARLTFAIDMLEEWLGFAADARSADDRAEYLVKAASWRAQVAELRASVPPTCRAYRRATEVLIAAAHDDVQRAYNDLDDACNSAIEDPDLVDLLDQRLTDARARLEQLIAATI